MTTPPTDKATACAEEILSKVKLDSNLSKEFWKREIAEIIRRHMGDGRDKESFCRSLLKTPQDWTLSESIIELQTNYNEAVQALKSFFRDYDTLPTGSNGQLDIRAAFRKVIKNAETIANRSALDAERKRERQK